MDDLAVCILSAWTDLKVIAGQIGGNHGHLAMAVETVASLRVTSAN